MKKLLTIIFLLTILSAQAGKKTRTELRDCEDALTICLGSKDIINDTIFIYSGKEAVKVHKQVEKTKRQIAIENTKVVKSDNKTDVKTDDTRLWTRLINKTSTKIFLGLLLIFGGRLSKKLIGSSWIV